MLRKKGILVIFIIIIVLLIIGILVGKKILYPKMLDDIVDVKIIYEKMLQQNEDYYEQAKTLPHARLYYTSNACDKNDEMYVDVTVNKTLHNFRRGKVWITYTKVCKSGDEITYGSWDIPVVLDIKKKNGQWTIIDISEKP